MYVCERARARVCMYMYVHTHTLCVCVRVCVRLSVHVCACVYMCVYGVCVWECMYVLRAENERQAKRNQEGRAGRHHPKHTQLSLGVPRGGRTQRAPSTSGHRAGDTRKAFTIKGSMVCVCVATRLPVAIADKHRPTVTRQAPQVKDDTLSWIEAAYVKSVQRGTDLMSTA